MNAFRDERDEVVGVRPDFKTPVPTNRERWEKFLIGLAIIVGAQLWVLAGAVIWAAEKILWQALFAP